MEMLGALERGVATAPVPRLDSTSPLDEWALATIESARDLFLVFDRECRMRVLSDNACQLIGLPREDLIGRTILDVMEDSSYLQNPRETYTVLHELIEFVVHTGIPHIDDDGSRLTADGQIQPASLRLLPMHRGGEVVGVTFVVRDLTVAGSMMFRRAAVGMAHVNRMGNMREANDALADLVGVPAEELRDEPFVNLLHPRDLATGTELIYDVLQGRADDRQAELRLNRDAEDLWVLLSASSNHLGGSGLGGACVVVQDITERVRLQHDLEMARQRLEALALHDHLTGLPNRAFLTRQLDATQAAARGTGAHTAVLFVDLDDFKEVNDTAGHDLGDQLLRAVAERLRGLLRPADFAARLGGDEFVVCCADLDPDVDAARHHTGLIAARIEAAIAEPFETDGRLWQIGASVGLALSAAGGVPPEDLLRQADADMYRVKASRVAG